MEHSNHSEHQHNGMGHAIHEGHRESEPNLAKKGKYMITVLLDTGNQKRSIGLSYEMSS